MSATNLLAEDALTARLRDKLNSESMKLWLDRFYDPVTQTPKDTEVIALASRYAVELELPESEVVICLYALQRHALEKIAERETFKNTGEATLRIRYSGQLTSDERNASGALLKIQIALATSNGNDLKQIIANVLNVSTKRFKLIYAGKVLEEEHMLEAQNLKNGSQIMALFLATDKESFQDTEIKMKQVEEIKNSADYLASSSRANVYSLQVTDQRGKPLELPDNERKSLAIGLALHDKGRAALKEEDFAKALIFLLEADSVYRQCNSSLLDNVDNYGLLNLDIAWCYLSLQSIHELPAAETRLNNCERVLKKSYGADMERVVALKGSTGWEATLLVRLHLLQGIAAYHMGHIEKSRFLMDKVETELGRLKISDDKLAYLVNMGYTDNEARMALRATYGDTTLAVDWIIRKREEMEESKKLAKERRQEKLLAKKLGKCANGDPVNPRAFLRMKEMGYSPTLIGAALQRGNNDMEVAIQLLADDEFISQARAHMQKEAKKLKQSSSAPSTSTAGTSSSATSVATNAAAIAAADSLETLQYMADQAFNRMMEDEFSEMNQAEIEKSQQAYESLTKDTCTESEYVDLTLAAETQYLEQYKIFLTSLT